MSPNMKSHQHLLQMEKKTSKNVTFTLGQRPKYNNYYKLNSFFPRLNNGGILRV